MNSRTRRSLADGEATAIRSYLALVMCAFFLLGAVAQKPQKKDAQRKKAKKAKKARQSCDPTPLIARMQKQGGRLFQVRSFVGPLRLKWPKRLMTLIKRCPPTQSEGQCRRAYLLRCKATFGSFCINVISRVDREKNYLLTYQVGEDERTRHVATKKAASVFLISLAKRGLDASLISLEASPKEAIFTIMLYTSEWVTMTLPKVKQLIFKWQPKGLTPRQLLRREKQLRMASSSWKLVGFIPSLDRKEVLLRFGCYQFLSNEKTQGKE